MHQAETSHTIEDQHKIFYSHRLHLSMLSKIPQQLHLKHVQIFQTKCEYKRGKGITWAPTSPLLGRWRSVDENHFHFKTLIQQDTFTWVHRSYWSLRFCRFLNSLLCRIRLSKLWRIWQGRVCGGGGCLVSSNGCSLIGHGPCGDPSLTAALAVGSLPATWRVMLLSLLVLPTVTLVFVLADVPAV